jgi:hypothetical protein
VWTVPPRDCAGPGAKFSNGAPKDRSGVLRNIKPVFHALAIIFAQSEFFFCLYPISSRSFQLKDQKQVGNVPALHRITYYIL